MTTQEYMALVQKVANYENATEAQKAIEAVVNSIKEVMIEGGTVELEDFGIFESMEFIGRICMVPGAPIKNYNRKDMYILRLRFNKKLKDKVSGIKDSG
jgi:nucleoid DNA-binding protein